jgi:hypothetical protein
MATLRELKRVAPKALGGDANSARNVEELLDAAIAHANGDLKPRLELHTWRSFRAQEGNDDLLGVPSEDENGNPDWREIDRTEATQLAAEWNKSDRELFSEIRGACVDILEAATRGQQSLWEVLAPARGKQEVLALPRGRRFITPGLVISSPKARWSEGRIVVDWEIGSMSPTSAASLTALALSVLASRTKGDALPIGRCTLDSCGKFFIIRKQPGEPGRLRTKYCSTDHMAAAHQAGSHERVRLSRERKRLAKLQKHKRRMPK